MAVNGILSDLRASGTICRSATALGRPATTASCAGGAMALGTPVLCRRAEAVRRGGRGCVVGRACLLRQSNDKVCPGLRRSRLSTQPAPEDRCFPPR
jgi:hypothetical protein